MRTLNPAETSLVSGALDGALYLALYTHVSTPDELNRIRKDIFITDAAVLGSTLGASGALHYLPHFSASMGVLSGGTVFGVLVGGAVGYAAAKWITTMQSSD